MIPRRDPHALAALKIRLRALETAGDQDGGVVALGVAAIDDRLPGGGLPRIGIHEVIAGRGVGAGFAALLAAKVGPGPVLWVARHPELYGAGLGRFGLAPERLVLVQAAHETEVLWVMEEGLRSGALAAVVGELHALDLTAGRRLQLAAEAGGGTGLVLRPEDSGTGAGAACSRWRVQPWPSRDRWTCWRLVLERCRGLASGPGDWIVEWDDATGDFAVAAEIVDRPVAPARPTTVAEPDHRPAARAVA